MFWAIGAAALFAAALITFLPLLRGTSFWKPAAIALMFLLPVGGLWIYSAVGTPEAIGVQGVPVAHVTGAAHDAGMGAANAEEMEPMLQSLRARLTETPEDLDGWVLLARTLKTLQRFPEALEALETAHRIAPDDPFVMVELAEARIFTSTDGRIDEDSVALLERAVELEPTQQKGLWLLGIAAAQAGDDAFAISYWESLLAQLEPGSPVAQSVQAQVSEAQARLGMEVEAPPPAAPVPASATMGAPQAGAAPAPADPAADPQTATADTAGEAHAEGWQGTTVRVTASAAAQAAIPAGAVLFVVIRSPGPAVGPPIGVRRIIGPVLPLELTITDQDSMLAERKISLEREVQLQARVSLSGSPAARPGDWQSAPQAVSLTSDDAVELVLDQQVE
jgi:cytochrome c-type biogenesis protein CcmH